MGQSLCPLIVRCARCLPMGRTCGCPLLCSLVFQYKQNVVLDLCFTGISMFCSLEHSWVAPKWLPHLLPCPTQTVGTQPN